MGHPGECWTPGRSQAGWEVLGRAWTISGPGGFFLVEGGRSGLLPCTSRPLLQPKWTSTPSTSPIPGSARGENPRSHLSLSRLGGTALQAPCGESPAGESVSSVSKLTHEQAPRLHLVGSPKDSVCKTPAGTPAGPQTTGTGGGFPE